VFPDGNHGAIDIESEEGASGITLCAAGCLFSEEEIHGSWRTD